MKRKLKKKVKIFIVIIFILTVVLGALLLFKPSKNSVKKENKVDINIVDKVYKRINDDEINIEFLTWINKNYKDSLNKINKLLKKDSYDRKMWHEATGNSFIVLKDLYENKYENMDNVKIISSKDQSTISFVGDVSLADNWFIAPVYDERGGISGILGDKMLKIMTSSDVMIANSEFTVSSRGAKIPNKMYTFRAKKERLSIYDEMGVDMVTLANNHVYDYGADAFLDMLDAFNEYKIPHIGAGHNIEEAKKPFYFIINGYKFAFVSATRAEKFILTPGATDTEPGVFRCYDPTDMINLIKELRPNNDYVIPIIHFGRENSHSLEDEQVSSAKAYIDAGADMVVGDRLSSTYFKENKRPFHNLGNSMVRWTINTFFGSDIKDIMTGCRAFSYQFVKSFPVLSRGFEVETEMSIWSVDKNMYIVNIPISYRDRPDGSKSKLNTYSDGFKVIMTIIKLFKNYKPMAFFGIIAFVLALISVIFFIPILAEYFETGLVPNFPTLIMCGFVFLAAIQAFFAGLVLENLRQKDQQDFELKLIDIQRGLRREG